MNKTNVDVEEMLRAAQDELLLNLSINSHTTRVNPDYLLPDLDRRFQALKSQPPHQQLPRQHENISASATSRVQDPDDLLARFAMLKGSSGTEIHSPPSDVEEDEVDKIIRWAKDAARLDPSPPSDDDAEETDDDNNSDQDDDDRVKK